MTSEIFVSSWNGSGTEVMGNSGPSLPLPSKFNPTNAEFLRV